ncbi:DUF416 family protein [Pedobacter rhizosphaerae]|uniref:Uncharacterized protein YjaG, DUF416 family n=1 Tax=Pedobacter rhizosphaerae TaxID=390241 RepID=A0A1H9QLQ4_9SPHI|nr:DUF416 family protein [Pedobacter rhizosphaerae]SER61446.1 Uncharacterized protein YjaG, DUF416 family [Pedobacter rhizosphaerae]
MDSIAFSTQLASQIASLSRSQRLAFGLDLCNRLLPDYITFFQEYNWGDAEVLIRSLEYVKSATDTEIDEDKVNQLMDELDLVIPDTEEFGDFSTSYAINASCAVWELLEYLLDDDQTHFMHMSTLATDTIDFKLQEIVDTLTAEELATHPMRIKEWQYQLEISR